MVAACAAVKHLLWDEFVWQICRSHPKEGFEVITHGILFDWKRALASSNHLTKLGHKTIKDINIRSPAVGVAFP